MLAALCWRLTRNFLGDGKVCTCQRVLPCALKCGLCTCCPCSLPHGAVKLAPLPSHPGYAAGSALVGAQPCLYQLYMKYLPIALLSCCPTWPTSCGGAGACGSLLAADTQLLGRWKSLHLPARPTLCIEMWFVYIYIYICMNMHMHCAYEHAYVSMMKGYTNMAWFLDLEKAIMDPMVLELDP